MKIALITIHNANNYGAGLQAYATKKVLSEYGKVTTINYNNRHLSRHLDLLRFEFSIRGLKMLTHDIIRLPYRYKAVKKFKAFINENMNLTKKLSSDELMHGKADSFDVYVCGSDQIWNPEIVSKERKINTIFFLEFAQKGAKKLSYASSIGHHIYNDIEKKEVSKLLDDFNLITVRESDGVKKIEEIFPNRKIHQALDPTLLLSKEEWLKTFNIKLKEPREKYILVYSVPRTRLIKQAIDFYADKLNMKVIAIDQMFFPISKQIDHHIRDAGPREFIELYANASFIITDSFHGTCFAVNFGKPFVSIAPGNRTNRIDSLLTILNINERLIKSVDELKNASLNISDNKILKKLRDKQKTLIEKYIYA